MTKSQNINGYTRNILASKLLQSAHLGNDLMEPKVLKTWTTSNLFFNRLYHNYSFTNKYGQYTY